MNIAMTQTILVRESVLGNPDSHEFRLEVPAEQVTVEELIRSRVFQEVKDLNLKANTKGLAIRDWLKSLRQIRSSMTPKILARILKRFTGNHTLKKQSKLLSKNSF